MQDKASEPVIEIVVPPAGESEVFYKMLESTIMTTFQLPHHNARFDSIEIDPLVIVKRMPFAAFAVREPFTLHSAELASLSGTETVLCARGIDKTIVVSMIELRNQLGSIVRNYMPSKSNPADADGMLLAINRLYGYLYGRKHRFVEEPISRQVRRAENRTAQYRYYIVVPRESVQYEKALRPSEIVKRLRALHVVRGFEREYRHERYRNVRGQKRFIQPFLRGKGELVQVKDYFTND